MLVQSAGCRVQGAETRECRVQSAIVSERLSRRPLGMAAEAGGWHEGGGGAAMQAGPQPHEKGRAPLTLYPEPNRKAPSPP